MLLSSAHSKRFRWDTVVNILRASISPFAVALVLLWISSEAARAQPGGGDGLSDGRCYELRTYTTPEDKLDDLNRRFRKYSRIVFSRYRMARLGFWIPLNNPENHFTYILSYADCEDRDPAWEQFRPIRPGSAFRRSPRTRGSSSPTWTTE